MILGWLLWLVLVALYVLVEVAFWTGKPKFVATRVALYLYAYHEERNKGNE